MKDVKMGILSVFSVTFYGPIQFGNGLKKVEMFALQNEPKKMVHII